MYEKLFQMMQDAERGFDCNIQICFNPDGHSGFITKRDDILTLNPDSETFSSLQEAEQILNDMFSM